MVFGADEPPYRYWRYTVHALVAAGGGVTTRFSLFVAAAKRHGATFVECTEPSAAVRLGMASSGGPVLDSAVTSNRALAVLGSGLLALDHPGADRLLEAHQRNAMEFLDGAPEDLAALVVDLEMGNLTIGAGSGNHRLFLAECSDGILVSTHLGLLATALGDDLRVDRSYEDFLLGFGFLPDGRTLFSRACVHAPGTVQEWPSGSSRPIARPRIDPPEPSSDVATARRVALDTFLGVLEDQAGQRRRHAVLLGGFDSALVASGLRRLDHEVDTYTFAFGDPRFEQRNAELVASHVDARHTWVRFTPEIIGEGLEQFSDLLNQPGAQPHYQLHTIHASRIIAEDGHDHIFTGDGCDAAFLGYPTVIRRAHLVDRMAALPQTVRASLLRLASARPVERRAGHVARLVRSTLRSLELPWPARGHLPTQYLDEVALRRLRIDGAPSQRESVREVRLRLADGLEDLDAVRLAFHGNSLTGQSKAKVEGAVTVSGVAQMSPYRDRRVQSLARTFPVEYLRPPGRKADSPGKALLFEMAREHELLPDAVIEMPKQSPVDSPIDRWYAGPLRPLVYRMLDGLPFEYDRDYVDEILTPKLAEQFFRQRVSLSPHAFQAIGLLCSYASFTSRAS